MVNRGLCSLVAVPTGGERRPFQQHWGTLIVLFLGCSRRREEGLFSTCYLYCATRPHSARSLAAPAPRSFSRSALFQPLLSPSPHTFCPKSYLRFGFTQSQPHSSAPATCSASTLLPVAASSAACLAAVSEVAPASGNSRSVYMSFSLSSSLDLLDR